PAHCRRREAVREPEEWHRWSHDRCPRPGRPGSCDASANELFDPLHDVTHVELGRVDALRILGRLHARRVALVPQTEIRCERVAADVRPLLLPAVGTDLGVGVEVDLHVGVRHDHCPDVATVDHRVSAVRARARGRMPDGPSGWGATIGTRRSISAWRMAWVTSVPAIVTVPSSSRLTGFSCARRPRAPPSSRSMERSTASQVTARYMAPVSRYRNPSRSA